MFVAATGVTIAFLAIFFRFVHGRLRVWEPLSRKFLLAMVGSALPPFIKFASVLAGAVVGSSLVTRLVRYIPGVANIV